MAISITNLSGGNTPADGSDPRTFPAIWNATATDLEGVATDLDTLEATVGAHDLNSLSGVGITTPVEGDLLTYNGTSWVNGVPAGSILQVVSTTKVDASTTTSPTLSDVSGLSLSITPSSTSSKILIMANLAARNATTAIDRFQLVRNSTSLAVSTGGSTENGSFAGVTEQAGGENMNASIFFDFLDSPASSSSLTYKVQFSTSGGTLFVGRTTAGNYGQTASITLMEVAG